MSASSKFIFVSFFLTAITVPSLAQSKDAIRHPVKIAPQPIKIKIEKPLAYLKWEQKRYQMNMPKNSSAQTQKELDQLISLQSRRTPEIEKKSIEEQNQIAQSNFWVARALKFSVDAQRFPATAELLDKALSDVEAICYRLAFAHLRPDPEQLDSKIKTALKVEPRHPNFPSIPACRSYTQSSILSSLYPAGRDQFSSSAYEVAQATEWTGTHFHSDNEAAQKIVETAYSEMKKNPKYLDDFAKAKAEWKRFR